MIVTLYNTEVTIADENRFERISMKEGYKVYDRGSLSGISLFYIGEIITIYSKNICVIDRRNKD